MSYAKGISSLPLARFSVIDLSAGPCTYGKIETEEGSVSYRTIPRLSNILFPKGRDPVSASSTHEMFTGQLAALISTTIEHVIAPDVRYYACCHIVLVQFMIVEAKKSSVTYFMNSKSIFSIYLLLPMPRCAEMCHSEYLQVSITLGTLASVIVGTESFETVDLATRLLIPIIVLQNHNRYNIFEVGRNYSIDMQAIETEVSFPFE
eukprot:Gb_29086 [translate_table: standard]